MIAVKTGAALAVARSGSTRVAAFTDLVQGLMDAGVAVVGSVLNEVPLKRRRSASEQRPAAVARRPRWTPAGNVPWLLVLAGFAAMYGPVYWRGGERPSGRPTTTPTARWCSASSSGCSGGIRRPLIALPAQPAPLAGWLLFAFGLLLYVVGRVVGISILEFGSQPFVVAGVLLLLKGPAATAPGLVPAVLFHLHDPAAGDPGRRDHRAAEAVDLGDRRRAALSASATRSRAPASCSRSASTRCWSPMPARACTRCTACRRSARSSCTSWRATSRLHNAHDAASASCRSPSSPTSCA